MFSTQSTSRITFFRNVHRLTVIRYKLELQIAMIRKNHPVPGKTEKTLNRRYTYNGFRKYYLELKKTLQLLDKYQEFIETATTHIEIKQGKAINGHTVRELIADPCLNCLGIKLTFIDCLSLDRTSHLNKLNRH